MSISCEPQDEKLTVVATLWVKPPNDLHSLRSNLEHLMDQIQDDVCEYTWSNNMISLRFSKGKVGIDKWRSLIHSALSNFSSVWDSFYVVRTGGLIFEHLIQRDGTTISRSYDSNHEYYELVDSHWFDD